MIPAPFVLLLVCAALMVGYVLRVAEERIRARHRPEPDWDRLLANMAEAQTLADAALSRAAAHLTWTSANPAAVEMAGDCE